MSESIGQGELFTMRESIGQRELFTMLNQYATRTEDLDQIFRRIRERKVTFELSSFEL